MPAARDDRLPVCLLTGFLGAGKSTLLNFVLRHPRMSGTAVVINEYGSVGIDHHLVVSAPEDTELVADGCLCCTAQGQLAEALLNLLERARQRPFTLRRVVVETTGLAEPGPILQQLLTHAQLAERFVIDSVVTLVDALNAPSTLAGVDIAVRQITGADRLLITKADLVDEPAVSALEQRLAAMNPDAIVERVRDGAVQYEQLFSGAHRRASSGDDLGLLFASADRIRFAPALPATVSPALSRAPAEHNIQTFSLILDEPLSLSTFHGWLMFLRRLCGPTLLRVKGIVHIEGQALPTVVHGVQETFHPTRQLPAWPDDDRRTRLVFITHGWGQDIVGSTLGWLRTRSPSASTEGGAA